jgi:hypothetical protein
MKTDPCIKTDPCSEIEGSIVRTARGTCVTVWRRAELIAPDEESQLTKIGCRRWGPAWGVGGAEPALRRHVVQCRPSGHALANEDSE